MPKQDTKVSVKRKSSRADKPETSVTDLASVYHAAYNFLIDYLDEFGLDGEEVLENELKVYRERQPFHELSDFYKRMLMSLMNRQGFPNYINDDNTKWDDTITKSAQILCDYDPHKVRDTYGDDWEKLLCEFQKIVAKSRSADTSNTKNSWVQFSKGCLSCASYLSRFANAEDFIHYAQGFTENQYSVIVLPELMSEQIDGFGFALACDFLKESGFKDFGKPDVHLMKIFYGIGLVEKDNLLVSTFVKMVEMARAVNDKKVQPVIVDKIFWLIGSGKFNAYNDNHPRNKIPISRKRDEFIRKYNADN